MKNCIILHGKPSREEYLSDKLPSPSSSHWIPWLQGQLVRQGIATQTPEILNAWQPDYDLWSSEFSRYDISSQTILIGHSLGGGFLVQYLSENPAIKAGDVYLVAPSFGDRYFEGMPKYEAPLLNGFFEFKIDPGLVKRCKSVNLISSDNDGIRIQRTVEKLKETFANINYFEFEGYGHFTGNMGGKFTELLDIILGNRK